jgi:hypothetical protein
MPEPKQYISFDPDDCKAGGLLNDINVVWRDVKFEIYDYGGKKAGVLVPALGITLEDVESGEELQRQYYKAGNIDGMTVAEGGKGLIALKEGAAIHNKSRLFQLMVSLRENGFAKEKLQEMVQDATQLTGLVCHMVQAPAMSKAITPRRREDGTEYEDTVLVVESIAKMPWEAAAAKKGKKGKAAAHSEPAVSAASGDANAETKAMEFVAGLIAEKGSVPKKDLPTGAFRAFQQDADRTQIMKLVFDDNWLGDMAAAGLWRYADGSVSSVE